jgi:hypothetical protein
MITLKCYEPPGTVINLDASLERHVIGFGSTGSGKTSALINPVLEQLVAAYPTQIQRQYGILVLDPKSDDAGERLLEYARKAGRGDDVFILGPRGNSYYDLFADFNRLEQVDEWSRRMLSASNEMGPQNAYWTETRLGLVNTALVLLLAGQQTLNFENAVQFLHAFVYDTDPELIQDRVNFVRRLAKEGTLKQVTKRRLEQALIDYNNWRVLDPRTKEVHRSAFGNSLRPVLTPAARAFFEPNGRRFDLRKILDGKLFAVSVDSVNEPGLASFLMKWLKRDFFSAVMSRPVATAEDRRCALIVDEVQLSLMPGDDDVLAVLRSKGGFVVAATQGVNAIENAVGPRRCESLLNNFCSYFFFHSRENALDKLAFMSLSPETPDENDPDHEPFGNLLQLDPPHPKRHGPICPPGSLGRLDTHQCYCVLADGYVTQKPVWLAPVFFDFEPPPSHLPKDNDLKSAIEKIARDAGRGAGTKSGLQLFGIHMHKQGHKLIASPSIVSAVWTLYPNNNSRMRMIDWARWHCPIAGLERLPSVWLSGLLGFMNRHPGMAQTITNVHATDGILWLDLIEPCQWWGEGALLLPEHVNLAIYPSLWRPIKPGHIARLSYERPDLLNELDELGLRQQNA